MIAPAIELNIEPEISCHTCNINILQSMSGYVIRLQKYKRSHNYYSDRETGTPFVHDILFSCKDCKSQTDQYIKEEFAHLDTVDQENMILIHLTQCTPSYQLFWIS